MDILSIVVVVTTCLLLGFVSWLGITATMPPREDKHVREVRRKNQRKEALEREMQRHVQSMASIQSTRFKARK